ncbi:MAG: phosphoribosylglycinamide formyltransferase [Armatimonadota bacterium]|nr:phosphoribosylglycinamide formyltransferase [Armatimonadota bacterium]
MPLRIAILVSGHGRGSNMAAIIDACQHGEVDAEVVLVIGTRREAPALQRAAEKGVPTRVISPRNLGEEEYALRLLRALGEAQVHLVCLAGYMRLLPVAVVQAYAGRVMNIHPALLPLFGGKGMYGEHVHQAVLESGMKVSGCTVHFVDEHYDTGPIIVQRCVPVEEGDTWQTLAARVLEQEHQAYVQAVKLFAEGRLRIEGRRVHILPPKPS